MKKLADDYIEIESTVVSEYQARIRDLEELATGEADICSAFYNQLHKKNGQLQTRLQVAAESKASQDQLTALNQALYGLWD